MPSTAPIKNILVLDAEQRSSLAVVRSLGQMPSVLVITADSKKSALAGYSRYSSEYIQYPSPSEQPQLFLQWLQDYILYHHIDFVFPVTEVSSQLIQLHSQLFTNCIIPYADIDTINALANKWQLVQLAQRLNLTTPKTKYFSSASELNPNNVTIYPVVLKPCLSKIWLGDSWLSTSVHIANNQTELSQLLADKPYFKLHDFMLQEFIPGSGAGIFTLFDHGKAVTYFAHQRLREKPPRGGVSVLSQSTKLNTKLQAIADALLKDVNWHGVAMIEFRIATDGTPYLMEVNTRFWGSLQLAIDSGIDFPKLLFQISDGKSADSPPQYQTGKKLRWLLGDIDSLYLFIKDPEFSISDKLKRIIAFLTPNPGSTHHEINRLDDIRPAWYELKTYIKTLLF